MQHLFAAELDVGERLYARSTIAASRKRSSNRQAVALEAAWSSYREQGVDVKAEVDMMFQSIMETIDQEQSVDESKHFKFAPIVLDEHTDSRIAAARALMRRSPAASQRTGGTFGSGRVGMAEPVRKTDGPGPGQYHPDESQARPSSRSSQRCSSSGGRSGSSTASGPPSAKASRGFSFGSGPRATWEGLLPPSKVKQLASAPGPGEYRVPGAFDDATAPARSKKGTFACAPRATEKSENTPGPGAYALDDAKPPKFADDGAVRSNSPRGASEAKGFLTSSPRMPSPKTLAPGPGTYHQVERGQSPPLVRDTPMFSIPKAEQKAAESASPGPGTYDLTGTEKRDVKMRGVIPLAGRDDGVWGGRKKFEDPMPGPGAYNPDPDPDTGAIPISMKFRHETKATPAPGPGEYDYLSAEQPTGPKWSLGVRRPSPDREVFPGPADYVTTGDGMQTDGPRAVFGSSKRDVHEDIAVKRDLPGPADYVASPIEPTNNVVFGSTKQRPDTVGNLPASIAPGPGAYEYAEQRAAPGGAVATTAPRFMPNATDVPGPGYYDAMAAALIESKRAASAVVGQAPRNTSVHFIVPGTSTVAGPGAYELPPVEKGPAFTMGLPLPASPSATDPALGPGAYAVPSSFIGSDAPKATMGTSPRFTEDPHKREAASVPGPGTYDPLQAIEATGVVFGTASKEPPAQPSAPVGPGAYDANMNAVLSASPLATIGTSSRFDREKEKLPHPVPGPGAYEPNQPDAQNGAIMGTAPGHATTLEVCQEPGPGAYEPTLTNQTAARNIVMGTSRREVALIADAEAAVKPGPGAYAPEPVQGHIPTPIISGRPHEVSPSVIPGPGAYYLANPDYSPSAVFGTAAARLGMVGNEQLLVPGPGSYALQYTDASPQAVFPMAPRFASGDALDGPGPGSYEPQGSAGPAISFGTAARPAPFIPSTAPGPGAYTPQFATDTTQITINAAPRPDQPPSETPGPGAYTPRPLDPDVHSVLFGANSGRRPQIFELFPGPGAYEISSAHNGPQIAFPLASRYSADPRELLPGPGHYMVSHPDTSVQVAFPKAPRDTDIARPSDIPGPGQYQVGAAPQNHQGHSFPQASPRPNPSSTAPGPGAYDVSATPGGPAYSVGTGPQRAAFDVAAEGPGPGAYDIATHREVPAFTIGGAPRNPPNPAAAAIPGPGAYNIASSPAVPAYTIGTSQRPPFAPAADTPGPGTYSQVPDDGTGPVYSVSKAPRFQNDPRAALPGPGDYDPVVPAADSTNLGAFIGTAAKSEVDSRHQAPGPGQYDANIPNDVISYSIGTHAPRFPRPIGEPTPGPAAYNPERKSFAEAPQPIIGTSSRFPEELPSQSPGPGTYHVSASPQGPAISFSTAPRQDEQDLRRQAQLPGPGQYDPNLYAAEGPAFSFAGKGLDPNRGDAELPGPGHYHAAVDFGADSRAPLIHPLPSLDPNAIFAKRVNATPGPAAYSLPQTLDLRAAPIGTAPRDPSAADDRHSVPGPGAYATAGIGMFDGPKYSIPQEGRRDLAPDTRDLPGPGAYNEGSALDRVLPSMPVHSIPQARRDATSEDARGFPNTGPGAYNLGAPPHGGPSYSFPQSQNFSNGGQGAAGDIPGPGMYFSPASWGLGGRSMGGKWPERHVGSDIPGPGHYRVHDYDPYNRDAAIGIDFSRGGERPCNVEVRTVFSDMPGPGQYYRGAIQFGDGHGVSILDRLRAPFVERSPGPPDYHHPVERHPFFDPLSH